MKVILIGAAGQLAADLAQTFSSEHDVLPLTRQDLDITDLQCVRDTLHQYCDPANQQDNSRQPGETIIVNTAAYNLVDQAESEPQQALAVNAIGPRNLALVAQELNARLVHFSTDYVFGADATRTQPFDETDPIGPVSMYGISKATGEWMVRAYCQNHLILRTCGLYGVKGSRGKGGNFVETMIRLARSGKTVRVVNDQWCTPSHTAEVARLTSGLIKTSAMGTFHVTSAGSATWFELACETFRQLNLEVDCQPITTREYPTPAVRPPYSVLAIDKLVSTCKLEPVDWRVGLADYLARKYPEGLPANS